MKKWEYQIVYSAAKGFVTTKPSQELESTMNNLGDNGWEIVSFVPMANSHGQTDAFVCVLKRLI